MIEEHPEIQALEAEREEIDRLEREHQERGAVLRQYYEAHARWRGEAQRAQLNGWAVSDPPEEPSVIVDEGGVHEFTRRRRELDERRRQVLVRIRPQIEEEAARREAERAPNVKAAVARLQALAAEATDDLREVRMVRQAVDAGDATGRATPGDGLSHRTRSRVEAADLLDVAESGGSLLAVAPAPGRSEERPHVDSGGPLTQRPRPFGTPYEVAPPQRARRRGEI